MGEIYFSVDIEADGPIPGPHSMLSLGSVAFLENGAVCDRFEVNFDTLDGSSGHPETMAWWATQDPEIWAAAREACVSPALGSHRFSAWVNETSSANRAKPVCVAYPGGFDFTFIHWYLMKFVGTNPFTFACLDVKSYAMGVLGIGFHATTRSSMPRDWLNNLPPHTHRAVDDALEQGHLFMRMRAHRASLT